MCARFEVAHAGFLRHAALMTDTLDDRDRKILGLLQTDAWLGYGEIGRRVNLSASAVQRRVERMIAAGIILGAHARVALADASPLIIFLLAELVDDTRETLTRFSLTIAAAAEVDEAHYVAGEADVVLKLRLKDVSAYDRFVATHMNPSPLLRRFKTFTSLRTLQQPVAAAGPTKTS